MGQRRKVQVELTLMVGREPWVRIQHPRGWFKLPLWVPAQELLDGALAGWCESPRRHVAAEASVRVPLSAWRELELAREALRQPSGPAASAIRLDPLRPSSRF